MVEESEYSTMVAFLAGAFVGAGIALLLAPQSGAETRNMLRDYANKTKEDMVERGKAALDTAMERGKEYVEAGKERAREYFESGKETMREAGKETTRHRG